MTTTDEARVTDEEIAEYVQFCRGLGSEQLTIAARAVLSLADRLSARDAEVAKLRELMSEARSMVASAAAIGIKRGVTEWLAKVDASRKGTP